MKKKGNSIISLFSVIALLIGFIFGSLNTNVSAEDTYGKLTLSKTAIATSSRTSKVTLEINTSELKQQTTDVVILMDRSGSMYDRVCLDTDNWYCTGERRFYIAQEQAIELAKELLPEENAGNVKVGFVSFGTNYESQYSTQNYSQMTSDRSKIVKLISDLPITNDKATNVHAGLKQAQTLLSSSTADNKIIILFA